MTKILAMGVAAALAGTAFAAEPVVDAGRKILNDYQDAVVNIKSSAKLTISANGPGEMQNMPQQEVEMESIAVAIDPSGLFLTSLAPMDPSATMNGQTVETPMGELTLKVSAEIKEIRLVLADGSEVLGDLVMKDPDLDVAFIRARADKVTEKKITFKTINLENSAKADILDTVLVLGRGGQNFNRRPLMDMKPISGVIPRPCTRYLVDTALLGCPVFNADGKLLGLTATKKNVGQKLGSGKGDVASPVVLSVADFKDLAKQAAAVKPDEIKNTKNGAQANDPAKPDTGKAGVKANAG